ncbi:hypothetical protein [Cytobacillus pseudoceanisediminis]|uniref:hypothetical protein n=1 Tax=Cytobacillus pseudoceanisediminis TaxID=3051614 RepID=UPI003C2EBE6D
MMEMKISDISAIQYSEIRKALGLNNNQKRPNKKSHYAFEPSGLWEDLAEKGFAIKLPGQRAGEAYYVVTFEAVRLVYRKNVSLEYYSKL